MLKNMTLENFAGELASNKAAPGGGSGAAAVSSFGAALAEMVCNFTIGKEKYAEVQDRVKEMRTEVEALRLKLCEAVDEDTTAYNKLSSAFKMPKETDEQKAARKAAINEASIGAMSVPRLVVQNSLAVLELAAELVEIGNRNLVTDCGCAASFAMAGLGGARMNVLVNLPSVKDESLVSEVRAEMENIYGKGRVLHEKISASVEDKL